MTPAADPVQLAAPPDTPPDSSRDRFLDRLRHAVGQGDLVKLVLAKYKGAEPRLVRVTVRPVVLRGETQLSFVHHYETRDITRNLPMDAALDAVRDLLIDGFRQAHLLTKGDEVELAISQRGQCTLRCHAAARAGPEARVSGTAKDSGTSLLQSPSQVASQAASQAASHDREKRRHVELDRPFLAALGVTDARHRLIPAMSRKWKQINKFVEVFSHALVSSTLAQATQVRVMDFGSGKGYLTFAVHDHLRHALGVDAQVTGVELRPDMVKLCNDAVAALGAEGLHFDQGDVSTYAPRPIDVMIALHACDTATDHAIHTGIRSGAAIILCSPCCHKQVRPQLLSPHPLRPILKHGIHLGQEAEMLTDGLRALLLESRGYQTQVFEFVSLEHTNKNKMILAVRRAHPGPNDEVLAQIDEIKRFYGIREHCLETLLKADTGAR